MKETVSVLYAYAKHIIHSCILNYYNHLVQYETCNMKHVTLLTRPAECRPSGIRRDSLAFLPDVSRPAKSWKCIAMSRDVSRCLAMSRDVSRCLAMSRDVSRCLAMSRDVSRCLAMSRDVSRCLAMSRDVSRCLAMSRDVSRCLAMSRVPLNHGNVPPRCTNAEQK